MQHRHDWYGVTPEDGFRPGVGYQIMLSGRRMFIENVREMVDITREFMNQGIKLAVLANPQTYYFHKNTPISLSADANLGLSIFAEAEKLWTISSRQLCRSEVSSFDCLDPFFKTIDKYLLFNWLVKEHRISEALETYRCVSASLVQVEQIVSLDKLFLAALFYSDLISWQERAMQWQRTKRDFFQVIHNLKLRHVPSLQSCNDWKCFEKKAADFVDGVCYQVLDNIHFGHLTEEFRESSPSGSINVIVTDNGGVMGSTESSDIEDLSVIGTDEKEARRLADELFDKEVLQELFKSVENALDRPEFGDNLRSDLLEEAPFNETSITMDMEQETDIVLDWGEEKVKGLIIERRIAPQGDIAAIDKLKGKSGMVARRLLDLEYHHEVEDHKWDLAVSGTRLNAKQLPLYRTEMRLFDRRIPKTINQSGGRPCLLILYDGSGSMNGDRFELAKVITGAFVTFGRIKDFDMMAAVYGSSTGDHLDYLVDDTTQWVLEESLDRIIHSRTYGGQKDALSLATFLKKARRKFGNRRSHLIFITDEGFCDSFSRPQFPDALSEVSEVLRQGYEELFPNNLEVTLVSFDTNGVSKLKGMVDEIIHLKAADLPNTLGIAAEVGAYVTKRMFKIN
ncbi:MAG: VWA domain-containing protein [Saprospiraceae bacterium]|nr:VWA domain-containing protein [Saprospiraceae bacterium]